MTIQLQNIYLYPIKSAQGYEVGQSFFLLARPKGSNLVVNSAPAFAKQQWELKKLNTNEQGEPVFGINLIPLNSGLINQYSQVKILSLKA